MNLLEVAQECGMAVAPSGNGYWDNKAQLELFANKILEAKSREIAAIFDKFIIEAMT